MRWINFIFAFPYTLLVSYPYVLFFSIFAARGLRIESDGTLTAEWRDWVTRTRKRRSGPPRPIWVYSTTLGHGVIFQRRCRPEAGRAASETWGHEFVHVRQTEDLMAISFLVGVVVAAVTGNWILSLALWTAGGAFQAVWFVTAGLRYGWTLDGVYKQSEHERSAYAQTDRWMTGRSWLQVENEVKKRN